MPNPPIVQVALNTPLRSYFDYLLPSNYPDTEPLIGKRVQVEFGKRIMIGVITAVSSKSELPISRLKQIEKIIDTNPLYDTKTLNLLERAARYYHHAPGEVLVGTLPKWLREGREAIPVSTTRYYPAPNAAQQLPTLQQRAHKQVALLSWLLTHSGANSTEIETAGFNRTALKALSDKQLVLSEQHTYLPLPDYTPRQLHTLNDQQAAAADAIIATQNQFQCCLLDGVTGSGKTEVYLHAIDAVIKAGKQALILVPEINLTPQTIRRFSQVFAQPVAVLHSNLSDGERFHNWLLTAKGLVNITIGTRSAIFTPMAKPGIIIIDEEHDISFKQQDGFRYSARDLAVLRGQLENIPIVLGSATPSLESYYNATSGRYQHLLLQQRVGDANPPSFQLLNIRNQVLDQGLSDVAIGQIDTEIKRGNQVLIFLNRRGYAPSLICHQCGWLAQCPRCDALLTVHQKPPHLHCHHCNHTNNIPKQCPGCSATQLVSLGLGTERVEEALQRHWPEYRFARVDSDTTRCKNSFHDLLDDMNSGDIPILLGTQMLAKGHHFPHVTLVVIVNADAGLFSTDFRATERTAQLFLQVAGRAGRADKSGHVLIQTRQPEHPLLQTLTKQGYTAFADAVLKERKDCELPPFSYCALLRAEANNAEKPQQFLQQARDITQQINPSIQALGPIAAPMARKAGHYRAHLLLNSPERTPLQNTLSPLIQQLETSKLNRQVRWSVDIDPQELN